MRECLIEEIGGSPVSYSNEAFLKFLISTMAGLRDEVLLAVFLDADQRFIAQKIVARGTKIALTVETRRLLRLAVERNAIGLVIAHNHPSGDPRPSEADLLATRSAQTAAAVLGITLIDHLIVAGQAVYSLNKAGQL